MNERKYYLQRHYISLNSRHTRHTLLTLTRPKTRKHCRIALLSSAQLHSLFPFLTLLDLTRLHEALHYSKKTKEGSKAIVAYLAKTPRLFPTHQQKDFTAYIITRKRKLTKWKISDRIKDRCEWERINWDIERTHLPSYSTPAKLEDMRMYLRRVLYRVSNEVARFSYVQGFHCIVKALYDHEYTEQEAFQLCSYLLREMKLSRYYENRLERMHELCYVFDVYVFNNLPELHFHLKRNEMTAQCYALSWFVTLYSQQLPKIVLSRLWTLFLLKGWKVLIKFGVALLCTFQNDILKKDESELPQYLRNLQCQLNHANCQELWQLFSSIKVTNKMVAYLSRQMHNLQSDREISVMQLKQMRDSGHTYESLQTIETETAPHYFSVGACCEKIEPSSSFPYCHDF